MRGKPKQTPKDDLAALAREIIAEHNLGEAAVRKGLAHFRKAGDKLQQVKDQSVHGTWLPWVDKLPFSRATAGNYMRLAKGWDKLPTDSNLTLRAALRIIAGKGRPEDDEEPGAQELRPDTEDGSPLPDAEKKDPEREKQEQEQEVLVMLKDKAKHFDEMVKALMGSWHMNRTETVYEAVRRAYAGENERGQKTGTHPTAKGKRRGAAKRRVA
jgi:hypothetical protein